MVYLTSGRPVIVCVTDGTGALTRAEITPDQSRSFFGRAPWQVQASSLRDLQVFSRAREFLCRAMPPTGSN